jgi:hypothetical protein
MAMLRNLPVVTAPAEIWRSVEAHLAESGGSIRRTPVWRLAWAAALLVAVAGGLLTLRQPSGAGWEVTRIGGRVTLASRALEGAERAGAGAVIATGVDGRVRIKVGDIGSVEVAPNTLVRLAALNPRHHRLALTSGSLFASITAPPRLFFVETPSATAIDLGCEYTLQCDRAGNGVLDVTAGWVAFEWKGRESLVPAGAMCRTRPGLGPGTPFFRDAPPRLVEALDALDTGGGGSGALVMVLAESRMRDTLSLWHLLARTAGAEREAVYERMAEFTPPAAGVSRDQVLGLEAEALTKWREELAWTW